MYRNSEGYADPTAGQALANARLEERRELEKYIRQYASDKGYRVTVIKMVAKGEWVEKSIKKITSLEVRSWLIILYHERSD